MWQHRYTRAETRMWPTAVVMFDPLIKDPPRVELAERNYVIETFPTHCSNQSLAKALAWGERGGVFKILRPKASRLSSSEAEKIESRSWTR